MPGRTLLAEDRDGKFKVELPEGAHITFGPDVPFERKVNRMDMGPRAYSLRVYADAGKKDLIATFSGVQWFRDVNALKVMRVVAKEEVRTVWKGDDDSYEMTQSKATSHKLVDQLKLSE